MTCVLCGGPNLSIITPRLRHGVPRAVVRCDGRALVSLEVPQAELMDDDTEYSPVEIDRSALHP